MSIHFCRLMGISGMDNYISNCDFDYFLMINMNTRSVENRVNLTRNASLNRPLPCIVRRLATYNTLLPNGRLMFTWFSTLMVSMLIIKK